MRIAIIVEGGNVQAVLSDCKEIEVKIFDYDNEPNQNEPLPNEYPEIIA